MMTEVHDPARVGPEAASSSKRRCLPETPGKSSTCTLQSEPVYNLYLLAADSSRKVDRLSESIRKSMDKIVISPNEITEKKKTPTQPPGIEPSRRRAIPGWARAPEDRLALGSPLIGLLPMFP